MVSCNGQKNKCVIYVLLHLLYTEHSRKKKVFVFMTYAHLFIHAAFFSAL